MPVLSYHSLLDNLEQSLLDKKHVFLHRFNPYKRI